MSLIELKNVKFKYTDNDLYKDVNFKINEGEHIVLLGPNGSGKTTLVNIIAKNIIPDSGEVIYLPNLKVSYLDQHLKVKYDLTVKEYLYGVFKPLYDLEEEMNKYYMELANVSACEYDTYLSRAQNIQEKLEKENFYAIDSKIGSIINGLGIKVDMDTKLQNLSGGEKEKVFLGKMLLEDADLLLLDEPTNFLDIEHIIWLENYLNSFKKAFLVVSHDFEFVKAIARIIYDLDNKTLVRYKGDFDFYLKEKDIRHENLVRSYFNQQKYIKETTDWIKAHIVRATSSRKAKDRQKKLDRLELIDKPIDEKKLCIDFPYSRNLGEKVLEIENLEIGYNNKAILPPISLLITRNQKVAILGKNGIGKSTFLKTIIGDLSKISGDFKFNPSADINYFPQEYNFNELDTPISFVRSYYEDFDNFKIRSALAKYNINGDLCQKKMKELSGGEQARVRLCVMSLKKSNILIFDEPSNHLDKLSKEALYDAIDNFEGSVILVSHEKDFYDDLVDIEINFD